MAGLGLDMEEDEEIEEQRKSKENSRFANCEGDTREGGPPGWDQIRYEASGISQSRHTLAAMQREICIIYVIRAYRASNPTAPHPGLHRLGA